MRKFSIALLLAVTVAANVAAQKEQVGKPQRPIDWYLQQYPFIQYKGIVFSFENQFDWPGGFSRIDSAKLTPFQFWVSNLPLWFKERPVGSLKHGEVYKADSVSRVVHLPWRALDFSDRIIPLQLMADYLFIKGMDDQMNTITPSGDTLTFDRFLSGTVTYGSRGEIHWTLSPRRAPSEDEYDRYFALIVSNTDYRSLLRNCEPVADSALLPGDIYVNCDSNGVKGRVAITLVTIQNANGNRLYIFGTGCPDECDFHIPLFNNRRDYPWTTADEVAKLMGPPKGISGFYRIKLPAAKN